MSMEHNYRGNNSEGDGCLICILVMLIGALWIVGNVALFGGFFDGLAILIIFAIMADMFILCSFIEAIFKRPSKNNLTQESSNQPALQQPDTESVLSSASRTTHIENGENSRLLSRLKSQYSVPNVFVVAIAVDPLQNEMEAYQCVEVLKDVNRAISRRRDCAKKMKSIKEEIDRILACPGCGTVRERLKYIKSNEDILQQKKDEYFDVDTEMKEAKVVLLSKEKNIFNRLSAAFDEINSSEKSASASGVAFSSFIKLRSSILGDIFVSEQAPIELDYGTYKFFLLPDVVLVYGTANNFVTALEPMTLIITIKEQKKSVYFQRKGEDAWAYTDSIIAGDSVLLEEGSARTSWLHERKNGGPDLRYSYNPRYESRTDICAYSDFSIQIGRYKAEYSISKGNLSSKFKPVMKDYCSIMHGGNVVPSLLRLLESVSKKREAASLLAEKYESVSKNIICKVSWEDNK